MKKYITLSVGAAMFTAVLVLASPVIAHHGRHEDESPQQSIEATSTERLRQNTKERVEALRAKASERRAQLKQDVCERQKTKLNNKIDRLSTHATKLKTTIDTMYERVQGFYQKGQLTVENYDSYIEKIDAAKTNASESIEVLTALDFELNCEDPDRAGQLASFRESVVETKDALKAYRKELVGLISAMRSAAAQTNGEASNE